MEPQGWPLQTDNTQGFGNNNGVANKCPIVKSNHGDKETEEAKISIKVIVDKVKKRVVYAEADYTFIDILFSFMTMPLGTVVRLLGEVEDDSKFEALGCLNNLYRSLKDFPDCYLATAECKSRLLHPTSLLYERCTRLKLKLDKELMKTCFHCHSTRFKLSRYCNFPKCHDILSLYCRYDDEVFVSKIGTFIVTDDLCVMPYTSATTIQLLTHYGITDMSRLEDVKLDLDSEKMLLLLKMALSLHSTLTDFVFHGINAFKHVSLASILAAQFDLVKTVKSSSSKIVLEVHLQKSTDKVLFAEAKEDFIDFLFSLLSIPLGTVVGDLLKGEFCMICMENIFKSISDMSVGRYLDSQDTKGKLLEPHMGQLFLSKHQLFPLKGLPSLRSYNGFGLDDYRSVDGGLLKQCGMFMVTDDLVITPSSSISTISTLNKLNVRFDDVQKYELTIGLKEGLKILKASLQVRSSSILTVGLADQLKKCT